MAIHFNSKIWYIHSYEYLLWQNWINLNGVTASYCYEETGILIVKGNNY